MVKNIILKISLSFISIGLGFLFWFLLVQLESRKKSFKDNLRQEQNHALFMKFESGKKHLNRKNYQKALDEFTGCLAQWNKSDTIGLIYLFNVLGLSYYKLEKNNLAIYYFEASLNLAPDNVFTLKNLASLYQEIGSLNQLKNIYHDLSKIAPQDEKTQQLEKYLKKRFENSQDFSKIAPQDEEIQ